ncbi:MAG: hypothetical protein IK084_06040 [Bacteroidaceae bacterium]|nr:hypothetical protein [Bacteroidaceae bacterium]
MTVVFKDIDTLSQKASLAGTEKIEVSDTEYITPNQIRSGLQKTITVSSSEPTSAQGSNGDIWIVI